MLNRFANAENFLREDFGNFVHLFVSFVTARFRFSVRGVVIVIHVTAGTITQDANERRALAFRFQKLADPFAKNSEVVSRDMAFSHSADVVQPAIRQQGDGASADGFNGKKIDLRIDRPCRLQQFFYVTPRVHHSKIFIAEGTGHGFSIFQQPTPIEYMLRNMARSPSDACRLKIVDRHLNAIGNALDDKFLVVIKGLVENGVAGSTQTRCRMRMSGGHQDILLGQAGGFVNQLLRSIVNFMRNLDVIDNSKGEPGGPVIKHQAADVQFIMNVSRTLWRKTSDNLSAEKRSDITCCRPCFEHLRRSSA